MILDFFSERGIKRLVFILFCIIALFWQKIIAISEPASTYSLISVDKFLYTVAGTNIYLSGALKLLLLLACAYCFIIALSVNNVLPKRKYLAVILFWAVVCIFADSQNFVNFLCALLFQMLALNNIFRIYRNNSIRSLAFITTFFIGISSMFSFSFIMSGLNILLALWIFYVIKWRDIISMILGLLTPFVFLLYFFQLAYHDIYLMWQLIEKSFAESILISFHHFEIITTVFFAFVFLTGLFSMFKISATRHTKSIYRITDQLFYLVFFISTVIFATLHGMMLYAVTIFGISSAYLITRFSQTVKRTWFIEFIVFVILLAAIFYNNYSLLNL